MMKNHTHILTKHVFLMMIMMMIIILLTMSIQCSANQQQQQSLNDALAIAAGIYKQPPKYGSDILSLNRTVLVTASNYGYLNHLMNFKCFLDRLNMKFLVFAFDDRINSVLTEPNRDFNVVKFTHGKRIGHESSNFRSKDFNIMSNRKFEATLEILRLGYDLIFADPDVVIIDDPIPRVIRPSMDYVHSVNMWCPMSGPFNYSSMEGNTGFYFVRSTPNTIRLWTESLQNAPKYPTLDDQTVFWETLRRTSDVSIQSSPSCDDSVGTGSHTPNELRICGLDECEFSSGMVQVPPFGDSKIPELKAQLKSRGKLARTIHANFMVGNHKKVEAFTKNGLWLLPHPFRVEGSLSCKQWVPWS